MSVIPSSRQENTSINKIPCSWDTKRNSVSADDQSLFPRIPPAERCCSAGPRIQYCLSARAGSGSHLQENCISHEYQLLLVYCPNPMYFDISSSTHPISFTGNHHWRCQLLALSGLATRTCQHRKICLLPQQRAPIVIWFSFTSWDEVLKIYLVGPIRWCKDHNPLQCT